LRQNNHPKAPSLQFRLSFGANCVIINTRPCAAPWRSRCLKKYPTTCNSTAQRHHLRHFRNVTSPSSFAHGDRTEAKIRATRRELIDGSERREQEPIWTRQARTKKPGDGTLEPLDRHPLRGGGSPQGGDHRASGSARRTDWVPHRSIAQRPFHSSRAFNRIKDMVGQEQPSVRYRPLRRSLPQASRVRSGARPVRAGLLRRDRYPLPGAHPDYH